MWRPSIRRTTLETYLPLHILIERAADHHDARGRPRFHRLVELLRDVKPVHLEKYNAERLASTIEGQSAKKEAAFRTEIERTTKSGSPRANAKYG